MNRLLSYCSRWPRNVWDRRGPASASLARAVHTLYLPGICRHTCASRLIQRGVPLPVVKDWMGHKAIQMTMRYAHLAPANLQNAAEALAQQGERFEALDHKLDGVEHKLELQIADVRSDIKLLNWKLGIVIAGVLSLWAGVGSLGWLTLRVAAKVGALPG